MKRGVKDGFLQKYRGTYCVSDGSEFDQKPSALSKKSNDEEVEEVSEMALPEKISKGKRKTKNQVRITKMKKAPIRAVRKSSLTLRPDNSYPKTKRTSSKPNKPLYLS